MSQKFKSELELQALNNATTDTDKFLVSDGGIVKYRTGTEVLSDLGVTLNTASKLQHQVKAGVAINKGQAVYVTSADGTNMIVGLASNAFEATSSKTMGLLDATVAINDFANVVTEGLLAGLNTSTANAGDPVWLGTGGNLIYGLLNKPYAPAHLVFIGIVTRVNTNNGEIFVKVQNGFELNEIHDIDLKTTTPINGHILGYDGTLWVNKTIAEWLGYTPANASGTTNYLSKFTGSTALGNSLLFDNGTGGVSIGKTASTFGTSTRTSLELSGSADSIVSLFTGSTLNGYWFSNGTNMELVNSKAGSLILYTNNSEGMRINASGNVGIGTSSPDQKLSIQNSGTGVSGVWQTFKNSSGVTEWGISEFSSGDFNIYESGVADARLYIKAGGNVGIGTTAPTVKLHVVGDVYTSTGYIAAGNSYMNSIGNTSTNNNANLSLTTSGVRTSRNVADSNTVFAITNLNASSTGAIQTWNNSAGELMRVTQNGNIGIGTSSPAYKLQVAGGIYQNDTTFISYYDGAVRFGGLNSYSTIITNTGNVGIGTASPTNRLQVEDSVNSIVASFKGAGGNAYSTFNIMTLGANGNGFWRASTIGGNIKMVSNQPAINANGFSASAIAFGSDTSQGRIGFFTTSSNTGDTVLTESMRIDTNGNVGIGTTSPLNSLQVSRDQTSDTAIIVSNAGTAGATTTMSFILQEVGTPLGWFRRYRDGSGLNEIGFNTDLAFSGNIASTKSERMRITSAGNVGIGTTNPAYKLDVNGSINVSSGSTIRWGSGDADIYNSGYDLIFRTWTGSALTEKLRITSAGNVGIGTATPQVDLEVASKDATSTVARIRLTNKDISVIDEQDLSEIQFYNSDADGAHVSAYIKNIAAELYGRKGQLAFGVSTTNSTNAVEAFRIDENANIGIGTTSPTDKLTVNGTFRSTALWTTSGGVTQWGNGTTSYGTLTWDAGYARIHAASGNRLDLGASAGLHMSIATSGNVGIGTTSPNEKLHVYGTSVGINIDGTTAARTYYNRNGSYIWSTGLRSGDTKFYIYDERSASRFVIDDSGNVGIGNTSPTQKLDVSGSIKASGSVQVGDDSTVASATNVGATRYRSDANNSYMDMVMQTGASTYAWVNVVQNTW